MHYVYLLQSQKDGGYYIGYSSDLKKRIEQHNLVLVDSTKNRRPIKLMYYESYEKDDLARERESKLKQFGSAYVGLLKRLKLRA